jgi:hypothetical protein
MPASLEPRRALLALAVVASACATYGPDVFGPPSVGDGGSAGATGTAGQSAGTGAAGSGGDGGSGGSGAAAGSIGEGGKPDEPATVPYVTGVIGAPSISVGLTLDGELDWAHWGLKNPNDRNHKANITPQLLEFKPTGVLAPTRYLSGPTTFTWSDGTPTVSASSADGIQWTGLDEGFELVVPAEVPVRRLLLYVGAYGGTGTINAKLSDPRANSTVEDRFTSSKEAWVRQVLSFEFGFADQPDTTLTVSFRVTAPLFPSAAVSLTAMSLAHH